MAITWNPGAGIVNTSLLTISDVGRVPNPESKTAPNGTQGRMNWGMIQYTGDPNTSSGKPSVGEIGTYYSPASHASNPNLPPDSGLAGLFRVDQRSVERWFGSPGPNDRIQYRNCVPLQNRTTGGRTMQNAVGRRPCGLNADTRLRVLLAACLTVRDPGGGVVSCQQYTGRLHGGALLDIPLGGLQREAVFTRGNKLGMPYVMLEERGTLTDAVLRVEQIYTGGADVKNEPRLSQGWLQITITGYGSPTRWEIATVCAFPYLEEVSDEEACLPDA